MKRIGAGAAVLILGLLVSPIQGQQDRGQEDLPTTPEGKTWKLVWQDDFDGTKLDESKWVPDPDGKRRDGWWSPKAITLDGKGHLAISTLKEGGRYIDGCITTRGKFEHAFGYYVARIQLQKQPGHWSAFWMMCPGVSRVGDGRALRTGPGFIRGGTAKSRRRSIPTRRLFPLSAPAIPTTPR